MALRLCMLLLVSGCSTNTPDSASAAKLASGAPSDPFRERNWGRQFDQIPIYPYGDERTLWLRFDYDFDGDVDSADLDVFLSCDGGPAMAPSAYAIILDAYVDAGGSIRTGAIIYACDLMDYDNDNDVDSVDFAKIQSGLGARSGTLAAYEVTDGDN